MYESSAVCNRAELGAGSPRTVSAACSQVPSSWCPRTPHSWSGVHLPEACTRRGRQSPGLFLNRLPLHPLPARVTSHSQEGRVVREGRTVSIPWTLVALPALGQGPADFSTRKESPLLAPTRAVGGGSRPATPPYGGMLTALTHGV